MVGRLLALVAVVWGLSCTPAAAAVLYVGDSLAVDTSPSLREQLDGVALDVDASVGRTSGEAVDVLRSSLAPEHDIVIFDLGTNDDPSAPATLASDLATARRLTAGRCRIVATLNRPPVGGVGINGLNPVVIEFASRAPAVELVDWHAAAAQPHLFLDGVHVGSATYGLRAKLFADAVSACASRAASRIYPGAPGHGSAVEPLRPRQAVAKRRATPPAASHDRAHGPNPLRAPAIEVARAVGVGAEFG
jgi:hypothetical protein